MYDGFRHFLFITPPVFVLGGIALDETFQRLRQAWVQAIIIVALLMPGIIPGVRLHPYQYTYYNQFVGGTRQASHSYETDYWLSSYKEAMEWVNQHSIAEKKHTTVLLAADYFCRQTAEYYKAPHIKTKTIFQYTSQKKLPPKIDYYISTTRHGLHKNFSQAQVVHMVGRDGGIFTVIKSNRKTGVLIPPNFRDED